MNEGKDRKRMLSSDSSETSINEHLRQQLRTRQDKKKKTKPQSNEDLSIPLPSRATQERWILY